MGSLQGLKELSVCQVKNLKTTGLELEVLLHLFLGRRRLIDTVPGKPSALFLRQKLLVLGVKLPKKIGHLAFQVFVFCIAPRNPFQYHGVSACQSFFCRPFSRVSLGGFWCLLRVYSKTQGMFFVISLQMGCFS